MNDKELEDFVWENCNISLCEQDRKENSVHFRMYEECVRWAKYFRDRK